MTSVPDILRSLNEAQVRYLLIGGYASIVHGVPRTTLDVDLAVDPRPENVTRAVAALRQLGLEPDTDRADEILGQGGVTATNDRQVDLLTDLLSGSFEALWDHRQSVAVRGVDVPVISRGDQIQLLRASGRPRDLEDAEVLEGLEEDE